MTDVHYLALSTVLTWIMLMVAAELRTPTWTREGRRHAFGNREDVPPPSPLAGRADRAAHNMMENMILFVPALIAARSAGADATGGAALFFFARLAYFPIYLVGVVYLRSLVYFVGLGGVAWLLWLAVR